MKLFRSTTVAVIDALGQIFRENRYADKVIEKVLRQNPKWGARDRKFIAETTYEMVRWYRLLKEVAHGEDDDFWRLFAVWCKMNAVDLPAWSEFADLQLGDIDKRRREVELVRKVRESIPDWLDELGQRELGKDWDAELSAMNQQAHVVLRANTIRNSRDELQETLAADNVETRADERFPDALILLQRQNIFQTGSFKAGLFEVQDAGSQLIAPFMQVEPGMRIIDACAGGGGKTLHLAAISGNKGRIIAMDTEEWKLSELKKRARRAGAGNIETRLINSSKVIKRLEGSADRLLLDVPCSGLGVLKRNPDAKWKLSMAFVDQVRNLQRAILDDYSAMVKTGGEMVYSTCSILRSENEDQVRSFLGRMGSAFELVEEKQIMPSAGFDGFYMARLRKKEINKL